MPQDEFFHGNLASAFRTVGLPVPGLTDQTDIVFYAASYVAATVDVLPRVTDRGAFARNRQLLRAAMADLESAPQSLLDDAAALHQEPVCVGKRASTSFLHLARNFGEEWSNAIQTAEYDAETGAIYGGNDDVLTYLTKYVSLYPDMRVENVQLLFAGLEKERQALTSRPPRTKVRSQGGRPRPDLSPLQDAIYQTLSEEYQKVEDIADAGRCSVEHAYRELANLARMGLAKNKRGEGYRRLP